jgi:hypothetical protein
MTDRAATVEFLKTELTALFPTNGVRAKIARVIGEDYILVRFTYYTEASQWASGIIENDPAFMLFMININKDGSAEIEYPSTHCNRVMRRNGPVKFRKINGKTEHDAAVKLVAWFKKNQAAILNAPNEPRF